MWFCSVVSVTASFPASWDGAKALNNELVAGVQLNLIWRWSVTCGMLWNSEFYYLYISVSWLLLFTQKAKMTDFDRYKVMKAKKMVSVWVLLLYGLMLLAFTYESHPLLVALLSQLAWVMGWHCVVWMPWIFRASLYATTFSSVADQTWTCIIHVSVLPSYSWGRNCLLIKSNILDGLLLVFHPIMKIITHEILRCLSYQPEWSYPLGRLEQF